MRTTLSVLLLSIGLMGCFSPRYKHRFFTNCDDGMMMGISSRVRMDGYWGRMIPGEGVDMLLLNEDGSIGYSEEQMRDTISIRDYYSKHANDSVYFTYRGRYKLYGDTIKAQLFYLREVWRNEMMEQWYVIDNDTTMRLVKDICYYCGDYVTAKVVIKTPKPAKTYRFIALSPKPRLALGDLRRKKWLRCR